MSDYRQEVETKETVDQLFRKILGEKIHGEDVEMMVTFTPDFQLKVEAYGGTPMYSENQKRLIFNRPWFTDSGQEEPYKLWRRV